MQVYIHQKIFHVQTSKLKMFFLLQHYLRKLFFQDYFSFLLMIWEVFQHFHKLNRDSHFIFNLKYLLFNALILFSYFIFFTSLCNLVLDNIIPSLNHNFVYIYFIYSITKINPCQETSNFTLHYHSQVHQFNHSNILQLK